MKGILVVLAFLQLVLLNEAFLLKKKPKTCPRNPKLDDIKKALGLASERSRRRKRGLTFPIDCLHAGIVELGDDLVFHFPLHECCLDCESPDYAICLLNGNPDFLCASRAYKCLCDCRDQNLGTFALTKSANPDAKLGTLAKGAKLPKPKKIAKDTKDDVCKKKKCTFGRRGCCVDDVCIKLFVHKKTSPVRPR